MIPYLRRSKIMELLSNNEILKIEDIQMFIPDVSISTIRRDLKQLEKERHIVLLTGGAVKLYTNTLDLPVSEKNEMNKHEKEIIAKLAADFISSGDTIYLDSGTSCTALAESIINKKVTIVTSNIAVTHMKFAVAEVISLGGIVNSNIASLFGPITDNNIKQFNFDKAFIGASGIDVIKGVSTASIFEANKKYLALSRAKESYVLCDSSKFHIGLLNKAFELHQCTVISDQYDERIAKETKMIVPK